MLNRLTTCTAAIVIGASASIAAAQVPLERSVQIRSINLVTRVVELHNFSNQTILLSGWQFCSADENETLKYSGTGGLNGRSIAPHGSFYVYWNNNAPSGPTNVINRTALGGVLATPLDRGPFGLAVYFPRDGFIDFNDPTKMADYAAWNVGGTSDAMADERVDEAVAAGLWTNVATWINTASTTNMVFLTDNTGGLLHGPANYGISDTVTDCNGNGQFDRLDIYDGLAADCNSNNTPDSCDITAGAADTNNNGTPDACEATPIVPGDLNCDGVVTTEDVYPFLLALTDAVGYQAQFPQCHLLAADIDDDNVITCNDWHLFKQLLPMDRLPRINGCESTIWWQQITH